MNSDEERKLFEKYLWTYDYTKLCWVSPEINGIKAVITHTELMEYTTTREGEQQLKDYIRRYGVRE